MLNRVARLKRIKDWISLPEIIMSKSPIISMIDSVVRCVKCNAKMGECDCWAKTHRVDDYPLLSIDKAIMQGLPCVKGTRITTKLIAEEAIKGAKRAYPKLSKEQILQSILFAVVESEI